MNVKLCKYFRFRYGGKAVPDLRGGITAPQVLLYCISNEYETIPYYEYTSTTSIKSRAVLP